MNSSMDNDKDLDMNPEVNKELENSENVNETNTEETIKSNNQEESDFISFDEINAYATFLGSKEQLNGFRPGRIPTQLLFAKYPIVDNLIEMYVSIKNGNLYKEGFGVKIANVQRFKNGLKLIYDKFPIEKKDEEESTEVDIGD